jgi:hypothetical protein
MMLLVRKERCPQKAVTGAEGLFAGGNEGLDIIPIAIDLGTHVYNSLTKEGYVSSGANLPQMPKLDDPAVKGWLDLIPVALDIGSQIYKILSKSAGPSTTKSVGAITETTMPSAATKGTTKEIVPSFSDEVLKAVGGK